MDGSVYFPQESAILPVVKMIKVLFPIYTSTWRVCNYVFRQGKGINKQKNAVIDINSSLVGIDTHLIS